MIDASVRTLVERALEVARSAGATYVDARSLAEESESINVQDSQVKGIERGVSAGIGVRVIADGAWGFAGTARPEPASVERAARFAVEIARSSRPLRRAPVRFAGETPAVASWASPVQEDPFEVPLDAKISLLVSAADRMREVGGISIAEASIDLWRRRSFLATSEGARIEQTIVQSGAGIRAVAVGEREVQQRSYPASFRGNFACRGYEHIRAMDLAGNAARTAEEAVALLAAPECPSGETTLLLDPPQLALQIHESIGHPIELDRVLGMEAAYAGTSFLAPADRGRLRYGSEAVNVTADATIPGALGSFGYDDEGVPARRVEVISEGIFRRFISSRETAPEIGEEGSNGTMRADTWGHIPLIRMTNINLEPGDSSLERMIAETDDGILMSTNQSWSIDDHRVNFQFGCEIAWEIKRGKRGRMLRNPNYSGRTTEFWSSCDAVAGPDEWGVWGTPNCGKGQPGQTARVAHGTSPARFRGVRVGVRG
ncbi:MAG: TldD/PmbA family protein [Acidobacteria bacterium]|nr:TldD/PmbA family protein [Acidobacteriota bacterium]